MDDDVTFSPPFDPAAARPPGDDFGADPRDDPRDDPGGDGHRDVGVVVGHDGSAPGAAAVLWAADDARRRGLPLRVVRAWTLSGALRVTGFEDGYVPSYAECEQGVVARLRADVEAALAHRADGLAVTCHVAHGPPARVLLASARRSALLVVGHRGRGGFAGLALGSVAEQVVRHASGTVVVVRAEADHWT